MGMNEQGWFGTAAGLGGIAAGAATFAFLASNPVGWATALALGAGALAGGAALSGLGVMNTRDNSIIDAILAESES
jgi:hypothetical protein